MGGLSGSGQAAIEGVLTLPFARRGLIVKSRISARAEKTAAPIITGIWVPLKARPTGIAMSTETTVETAVMTEAAKPAIWPRG